MRRRGGEEGGERRGEREGEDVAQFAFATHNVHLLCTKCYEGRMRQMLRNSHSPIITCAFFARNYAPFRAKRCKL